MVGMTLVFEKENESLVQQKVSKALDDKIDLYATMKPEEIVEMKEIAFSTIILYLADVLI